MILLQGRALQSTSVAASIPASSSSSSSADTEISETLLYEIPLAVLILAMYIVLGHGLELWKDHQEHEADAKSGTAPDRTAPHPRPMICTFHESGAAILLGLAVGLLLNYGASDTFDFDADVFFYAVLPPIIFHQGYAFKKRNFFKFFHYIFGFGIFGTMVQFIILSILCYYLSNLDFITLTGDNGTTGGFNLKQAMLLSSVFCAADEVATVSLIQPSEFPKLSAILFGEGVMNDALSILLFHAVASTGSGGDISTFAGVGVGSALLVSLLLKNIPSLRTNSVRQTAILMLGGYFSFSVSEMLELSGVLTVFFCGLTLSHYAWHSLGTEAQVASKITSDTISMIAEAYCFAAIGLSVHEFNLDQWSLTFTAGMMIVLMIARFVGIYGICLLGYLVSPKNFKMPMTEQNVLYFGGLVRGSISWAQIMQVEDSFRTIMLTTVLGIVLFTIIVFGVSMPFFTRHLEPEEEEEKSSTSSDKISNEEGAKLVASHHNGNRVGRVHGSWAWFDDNYMKPLFGGSTKRNSISTGSTNINSSRATMRIQNGQPQRLRTYSGITRVLPHSYGTAENE